MSAMMLLFNVISRWSTPEIVLRIIFSKYCKQGGELDYGGYPQVQTRNIFLEMANAKDHYLSLL